MGVSDEVGRRIGDTGISGVRRVIEHDVRAVVGVRELRQAAHGSDHPPPRAVAQDPLQPTTHQVLGVEYRNL